VFQHGAGPCAGRQIKIIEDDIGVDPAGKIVPRLPGRRLELACTGGDLRAVQIEPIPLRHELTVHGRVLKLRSAALGRVDGQRGVAENCVAGVDIRVRKIGAGQRGIREICRAVELGADERCIGQVGEAEVGRQRCVAAVGEGRATEVCPGEIGLDEDDAGQGRAVEIRVRQILSTEAAQRERQSVVVVAIGDEARRACGRRG